MHKISIDEYAKAVVDCIHLARQITSGGCVSAQVLLSAYNGDIFQLNVADMGCLDRYNFETVMAVIGGRYDTGIEPHNVVKDGRKIFESLWEKWSYLDVVERAKSRCPYCLGRVEVFLNPMDGDDSSKKPCIKCAGTGRICQCNS